MSMWPRSPMWDEHFRDFPFFDRLDRSMFPYWRNADQSVMHVANETQQVVNNEQKFAVSLDVSQFRPDELKVHIEGHDLIVEGKQQNKSEGNYMERQDPVKISDVRFLGSSWSNPPVHQVTQI
ncbi:hypothetical protein Y032_0009g404 [Ancylostoma ceylanicum]|uniref:SHSP domain-containing protein n=1 Tax=Ancylostoma ceylanicum TaxID=53326 RepID=A0A016VHV1_9BILA|nr:hypothetical protein Y032_0009g404 [Ancylostoma ceylanicum]